MILKKRKGPSVAYIELEKVTKEKAKNIAFKIYNTYKDTHGMPAA